MSNTLPSAPNDADLDDLLQEDSSSPTKQNHLEMTPLNLDHLTKKHTTVQTTTTTATTTNGSSTSPRRKTFTSSSPPYNNQNTTDVCGFLQGSCTYLAYAHPRLCGGCALLSIFLCLGILIQAIVNPSLSFGNVVEDFSSSSFDLTQGQIDHWCLRGDDDSCRCEDPLVPTWRGEFSTWTKAHKANKDLLAEIKTNTVKVRVAFVGESLVEEMNGRWMGTTRGTQLLGMKNMFQEHFSYEKSGVEGIALGIAGDTSPNVLWRLMHGENPDWFLPDIYWISLGMNDLGRMQCSEEVVVIGILRVVEEILQQRPSAQVVINSMLPMADLRGGIYPHMRDYKDGLAKNDKASHYVQKKPQQQQETNSNNNKKKKTSSGKRLLKRGRNKNAEQEEGEDANNPEKLDKKTLRRYKKKDPINPVLDPNETKMKKYQLFKKNRLPLWTSIYAINDELKKFALKHERVTFYDATSIFAEKVERGKYMLKSDMISIRGHPTVEGFQKWEDDMLKRIKTMLAEQDDDTTTKDKKVVVKYNGKDDDAEEDTVSSSSSADDGDGNSSSSSSSDKVEESSSSESNGRPL